MNKNLEWIKEHCKVDNKKCEFSKIGPNQYQCWECRQIVNLQ